MHVGAADTCSSESRLFRHETKMHEQPVSVKLHTKLSEVMPCPSKAFKSSWCWQQGPHLGGSSSREVSPVYRFRAALGQGSAQVLVHVLADEGREGRHHLRRYRQSTCDHHLLLNLSSLYA